MSKVSMSRIVNKRTVAAAAVAAAVAVAVGVYGAATFDPDAAPTGYVAQGDLTDYNLVSGDEYIFQTEYEREVWTGNLYKYPVSASGAIAREAERWTGGAASHINAQNYDTGRKIVTMKSDGTKVPFRWASLGAAQQTALGDAATGPKILNFVRGDRSNEGSPFRIRGSVMGAIIHSRPFYVPGSPYGVIYVGGNDGMLHVIDDYTGSEVYAYVPSMLIPKLKLLAADPYVHTHFVDGSVNIANVTIGGSTKKILVGGLNGGGRGVYALDITNPIPTSEADAANKILWEITNTTINNAASASYASLGYTYATPLIVKLNSNSGEPAVIVPNGYLNTSTGRAVLYIVNAGTGALIRAIDCNSSGIPCGTLASPNGLSSATAVDANNDGKIDYVYAGDIDGSVWRFNLTSTTPASWSVTKLFATNPLQAITGTPAVAAHPDGGLMVSFGTGRMLTAADVSSTAVHYVYGIRDPNPASPGALPVVADLVSQTLTEKSFSYAGVTTRVRVSTANQPNWATHKGWRVPLPAGERVVGEGSFIESGRFYFNGYNPTIDNADPLPDGDNWLMELDYLSGGARNTPFLDLNGDLLLNDGDRIVDGFGVPIAGTAGVPVGKFLTNGVASQPVLVQLSTLNTTFFTQNPDVYFPPATDERGVANGHFDVDIYYPKCTTKSGKTTCTIDKSAKHFHEYDDIFDVTGVNFLNASSKELNLSNAITNSSIEFKVLMMNQSLNPAMTFSIDGGPLTSIKTYQTADGLDVATLPVYKRNLATLEANLPVNAFAIKDWWNTGKPSGFKVGLHPTQTGCVNAIKGSQTLPGGTPPTDAKLNPTPGAKGEWKNGAWVIQLIKAETPNSAIELNVAGDSTKGYRVDSAKYFEYVLAEYSMFWHHPNKKCMADAGWTDDAPPDTDPSTAKTQTPAPGSDDPKIGSFRSAASIVSVVTTVVGNVTTITTTYSDGAIMTDERTKNGDGTVTIKVTLPDGTVETRTVADSRGDIKSGGDEKGLQSKTGRVSWHELVRE